jgi:Tfp pilus assembly protein PilO
MRSSTRLIVSILVIAVLAVVFWVGALSPKREEASKLGQQADQLKVSLSEAASAVQSAEAARHNFPVDYRQLVVLGQAVPGGDETSSLLVELNRIAAHANASFESIHLNPASGETTIPETTEAAPLTPTAPSPAGSNAVQASELIPPTEAAASLLPLGASIGSAGLGVMPYSVDFKGNFFQIANLIKGIDSLVRTSGSKIAVDGRLLTLSGFSLTPETEGKSAQLQASFTLTSYLTPPSQGVTAGATEAAPATTVPAAEGETTEAPATSGTTSETVSAK